MAGAQGVEDRGELPSRMRYAEPVVGGVFGEAEPRNAEGEHRRAGHFQVEPSLLDFGEVDEEICFDDAGAPENLASRREDLFIAQGSEDRIWIHERKRTPRLLRLIPGRGCVSVENIALALEFRRRIALSDWVAPTNRFLRCTAARTDRYAKSLSTSIVLITQQSYLSVT